jgi:hypothetical protein
VSAPGEAPHHNRPGPGPSVTQRTRAPSGPVCCSHGPRVIAVGPSQPEIDRSSTRSPELGAWLWSSTATVLVPATKRLAGTTTGRYRSWSVPDTAAVAQAVAGAPGARFERATSTPLR